MAVWSNRRKFQHNTNQHADEYANELLPHCQIPSCNWKIFHPILIQFRIDWIHFQSSSNCRRWNEKCDGAACKWASYGPQPYLVINHSGPCRVPSISIELGDQFGRVFTFNIFTRFDTWNVIAFNNELDVHCGASSALKSRGARRQHAGNAPHVLHLFASRTPCGTANQRAACKPSAAGPANQNEPHSPCA